MIEKGNGQGNGMAQPPMGPMAQPQQNLVMEMHVKWINGTVQLSAPDNPVLFMRLMGDVMNAYALNTQQKIMKEQSRIIKPDAAVVDGRLMDKIKENQH